MKRLFKLVVGIVACVATGVAVWFFGTFLGLNGPLTGVLSVGVSWYVMVQLKVDGWL